MAKKMWFDAVKVALDIMNHRDKYAYFFGAKGEILTDEVMERLWRQYPEHFSRYTAAEKKKIFDYSRGKIGLDCSGFAGLCVDDMVYSGALIDHCPVKARTIADGVAGSVVWKQGHVGLDIGYGFYLHFPGEMRTCELGRFIENTVPWTRSGQHRNIDYTGADAR